MSAILTLPIDVLVMLLLELLQPRTIDASTGTGLLADAWRPIALEHLKTASLVCQTFYRVSRPILFSHSSVRIAHDEDVDAFDELPAERCARLRAVRFGDLASQYWRSRCSLLLCDISKVLGRCTGLRAAFISLDQVHAFSFDGLEIDTLSELALRLEVYDDTLYDVITSLLRCFPNLENLEIDAYALPYPWMIGCSNGVNLPRLRGLAAYEPKDVPPEYSNITALLSLETLGRLRELWTNDIRIFTNDSAVRDAVGQHLAKLEFYGPHHADLQTAPDYEEAHAQLLHHLEHFPRLVFIDLTCCTRLSNLLKPTALALLPSTVEEIRVNGCISYDLPDLSRLDLPASFRRLALQTIVMVCDHQLHLDDDVHKRSEQMERFKDIRQTLLSYGVQLVEGC